MVVLDVSLPRFSLKRLLFSYHPAGGRREDSSRSRAPLCHGTAASCDEAVQGFHNPAGLPQPVIPYASWRSSSRATARK